MYVKRPARGLPPAGFQTGSGQMGSSQKGHTFHTFLVYFVLSPHVLPHFAPLFIFVSCCHILSHFAHIFP